MPTLSLHLPANDIFFTDKCWDAWKSVVLSSLVKSDQKIKVKEEEKVDFALARSPFRVFVYPYLLDRPANEQSTWEADWFNRMKELITAAAVTGSSWKLFKTVDVLSEGVLYVILNNSRRVFEVYVKQITVPDVSVVRTPFPASSHLSAQVIYPTSSRLHKSLEDFLLVEPD
jgi:hypothetical protein